MTQSTEAAGVATPDRADAVIEAKDIVAGYLPGVNILDGCSLVAYPGEMIGIIGPNGAGKSTLLKALFGLIPVRSGGVTLRGEDITSAPAHRLVSLGVGYVPQNNNVFPSLTIEENMQMGVYLRPKTFKDRFDYVIDLFPLLGELLGAHEQPHPEVLLDGQRREDVVGLRHEADALADELVGGEAGDVLSVERDASASNLHLAEDGLQQR